MAKEKKEMAEETPAVETAAATAAESAAEVKEETLEAKQEREAREDYQRRNEEALTARREILERNGLVYEEHTVTDDSIPLRCC